jgi:hypothetical protein
VKRKKEITNYHLKNAVFFVDGVDFDRINDRDLIGFFAKDLIGNWIGKFIFLKIGIGVGNEKNLIASNPEINIPKLPEQKVTMCGKFKNCENAFFNS